VDTLTIDHIGWFNVFCLILCSVLSILAIVVGDEIDFISGILTLLATVTTGFSFVVPWTIFSIMGVQIATFFFMSFVEGVHFTVVISSYPNSLRLFLIICRCVTYFMSALVSISYLRRLLKNSHEYTEYIKNIKGVGDDVKSFIKK